MDPVEEEVPRFVAATEIAMADLATMVHSHSSRS